MATNITITTIRNDLDIVVARTSVRELARQNGFSPINQARIATAVSELSRNIFLHAGTGEVKAWAIERNGMRGIECQFTDNGPGINDVSLALQEGFSSTGSEGMGLPGAKRMMDEFDIDSTIGVGTKITCRKWKR